MQFATPWDERSAETSYAPVPLELDFDQFFDFDPSSDLAPNPDAADFAALNRWTDHLLQGPTDAASGNLLLVEPPNAGHAALGGVSSSAHGGDLVASHTEYQYPCTSLQAGHGTESVLTALPSGTVPSSLDNSTSPGLNTSTSALDISQQLLVEDRIHPYEEVPTHLSQTDLFLAQSPSPLFDASAASGSSPYVAPSSAYSHISEAPSFVSEFRSDPVSPAFRSEWTPMYSPPGSSPVAGSIPQYATKSSTSLSPVCSVATFVDSAERSSCSTGKSAARRGRPKSSASLSIASSTTSSSSPSKVRAAAPRNKQIHYGPYEVPDGPLDHFVCPYCEPGRPFATPRRGRRKHDIERHLKTHYSEASRSEGSELQVVCDRVVPIESLPGPRRPEKWWECGGRRVVGGCAKVFGREDSLLRHLKVGCNGPKDQWDCDAQ